MVVTVIIILMWLWQKNHFYGAWVCVTIKMAMVMVGVWIKWVSVCAYAFRGYFINDI